MIKEIKRLWGNKKSSQGRIEITVFFLNIFLMLCHVFLMAVYVMAKHNFMIYVNIVSFTVYICFTFTCYKKIEKYVGIAALDIWLHMLCAIISFGWTPCFQNWSFALIAGYFLPSFGSENQKKYRRRSITLAFAIILSYFVFSVMIHVHNFETMKPLSDLLNRVLFTVNNLISFTAIMMFAIFYTNKTKRKELELSRKADYDELTGLYNRHAVDQISDKIIDEAKYLNRPYNVAIVDIDFFKNVNDTYGHVSGDIVLKELADIFRLYMNKGIIPSRWGGEEFLLITPCDVSYKQFMATLERIRVKVSKTKFSIEGKEKIDLTISIGAAAIDKYDPLEEVISVADKNLYKAKKTGRNKLVG